jgi:thiamine kinase-like enzyme
VVIAPDREDLICHHDLAPWNLVRDGDRWVFIDWDGACPAAEYIEAHLQGWSAALLE